MVPSSYYGGWFVSYNDMPPEYREVKINFNPTYRSMYATGDQLMWHLIRLAKELCPGLILSITQVPFGPDTYVWFAHRRCRGVIRINANEFIWTDYMEQISDADHHFHYYGRGMIAGDAMYGR